MQSDNPPRPLVRILVVDDHQMFADSLIRLLDDEADFSVTGTARTIAEASNAVCSRPPDVVVVDYRLPDGDGAAAVRQLRALCPDAHFVMITGAADHATLAAALGAGSDGLVTKDLAAQELVETVRAAAEGRAVVPDELVRRLLPIHPADVLDTDLTARERQILQLIVEGCSNAVIADRLAVSINTVRNHVQNLLGKLGAHSKLEAAAIGVRLGLVPDR